MILITNIEVIQDSLNIYILSDSVTEKAIESEIYTNKHPATYKPTIMATNVLKTSGIAFKKLNAYFREQLQKNVISTLGEIFIALDGELCKAAMHDEDDFS